MNGKILFYLPPRLGIGGITKAICFVANTAAQNGYDAVVVGPINKQDTLTIDERIHWYNYNAFGASVEQKNQITRFGVRLKALIALRFILRKERPNLVVAFGADNVRFVLAATIGLNTKVLGSERGNPWRYSAKYKRIYQGAYLKCDKVVFQTEEAMSCFNNTLREKGVIIPNPAIQRVGDAEAYAGPRRPCIVLCGSLTHDKNFALAIDAFAKVAGKYDEYEMRIYGAGQLHEDLQMQINTRNLQNKIFICNPQATVFQNEKNCSMFILSSQEEGMPNVLLEALALGIPCISTDCPSGGARLVMGGGQRGLLVPNNDVDALASAILLYIERPDIRDQYSKAALTVLEEFSASRIADMWCCLLAECLGKKRVC